MAENEKLACVREIVKEAEDRVDQFQRQILYYWCGIGDDKPHTVEETVNRFGITVPKFYAILSRIGLRVCRIRKRRISDYLD